MNASLATPAMTGSVTIRGFAPADAGRICALFSRYTPYRRDAAFWRWLNRTLPARPSIVAVAESGGEIVGHYGILPFDLRLPDGGTLRAGHGVHAFVRPDFRDRVSIFQVSAHAYTLARDSGIDAVYGFPNARYRLVQEKIERWRGIALFKAWTKSAADIAFPAAANETLTPADLERDDDCHTALRLWELADAAPSERIQVAGTARWWTLRYLLHPHRPYSYHWYVRDGERLGLIVAKVFEAEGERRAHLVDYVLSPGMAPDGMLRAFERKFTGEVSRFVHWPIEPRFTAALVDAGYRPDGFETYFGLRRLRPAATGDSTEALLDAAAWRLPMGLSDAF